MKDTIEQCARYIQISFPYREDLCSYTFPFEDIENRKELPLILLGYWQGTIDLKEHKLLEWKSGFGECYFQAKVRDEGTYMLLDTKMQPLCTLKGYVPNGVIPPRDGCGDYIHFYIDENGKIEEWNDTYDFSEFKDKSIADIGITINPPLQKQRPTMKFHAIRLFTNNQASMVNFYRDIWGFKTSWNGSDSTIDMVYENVHLIISPRKDFGRITQNTYPQSLNNMLELTFDLPTFNDVDNEYTWYLQQGVKGVISPTTKSWGERTACIADPDGNLIKFSSFSPPIKQSTIKTYTLEEKRQEHGNAYLPWDKESDKYLIRLYDEGQSIKEIAEIFERTNGAIRSRLKKLGKIQ